MNAVDEVRVYCENVLKPRPLDHNGALWHAGREAVAETVLDILDGGKP